MRKILCILAGGESSRFGSSKLHVRINDQPIVSWIARGLGAAMDQVWLNLAPGQPLPPGGDGPAVDRVVRDALPHQGPLAGMRDCLKQADPADIMVFAAGDMPLIQRGDADRLLDLLLDDDHCTGVMGRWADGPQADRVEPLPSAWRAGPASELIEQAMQHGVTGPSRLAQQPRVRCVPLDQQRDASRWLSINRPIDLVRVARAGQVSVRVDEQV